MFDRRQFGIALLAASTTYAQSKDRLSLGFSLYGLKDLPWREAIDLVSQTGFNSVELAVMPGWHGDPEKFTREARTAFRQLLADRKMNLAALMDNLPLQQEDKAHATQLQRWRTICELAKELQPASPPVLETILGGKPGEWESKRELYVRRLRDWAKIATETETTIAIKAHRMGVVNHPDHLIELLKAVDSPRLRCVFDYSHFEGRDLDLEKTLDRLLPFTAFIHVKDTVFNKSGEARFVLPGEGATNYTHLLRLLQDRGYRGSVCVEVSGMVFNQKGYDPVQAVKRSYQVLQSALPKD